MRLKLCGHNWLPTLLALTLSLLLSPILGLQNDPLMQATAYFEPDIDTKTYTTMPLPRVPPSPYAHLNVDPVTLIQQDICPAGDGLAYGVNGFPGRRERQRQRQRERDRCCVRTDQCIAALAQDALPQKRSHTDACKLPA